MDLRLALYRPWLPQAHLASIPPAAGFDARSSRGDLMTTPNCELHLVAAMCKNVSETDLLIAYYAASLFRFQVAGTRPNGIASQAHDVLCFGTLHHVAQHAGKTMTNAALNLHRSQQWGTWHRQQRELLALATSTRTVSIVNECQKTNGRRTNVRDKCRKTQHSNAAYRKLCD